MSFVYTDTPARELGADLVVDRLDQVPGALARIGPGGTTPAALSGLAWAIP